MNKQSHRILGIDGGATKTEWAVFEEYDGDLKLLEQGKAGGGSCKLESHSDLENRLRLMPREVDTVGIYLAGCVTDEDRSAIASMGKTIWPEAQIVAGSDRDAAYSAAFLDESGIIVIAGTGSAVTGKSESREERAGGWGHVLGDAGGGYDLSVRMLRRILWDYDVRKITTSFAHDVLRTLHFPTLAALSDWALNATKAEIAALSPVVFRHDYDPEIQEILESGANTLAVYCEAVAKRLGLTHPSIRLTGGLFFGHRVYEDKFRKHAHHLMENCSVKLSAHPAAWGAAWLASHRARRRTIADISASPDADNTLHLANTESRNPRSLQLDTMSIPEMVTLFIEEEHAIPDALRTCEPLLCEAVEGTVNALQNGGRLFYIGAGTSGRLGVLDASEIPPTFGMPASLVQGLIAGGRTALWASVEGAEDDRHAGVLALQERDLCATDAVCGIAASGRTPYVLSALEYANTLGCFTILLTCNPNRDHAKKVAEIEIDLPTGAEILTGSTRLKAGTATKIVLNILSTCTMVRLGRVTGNQMTSLTPTNTKLQERAIRMVVEHLHCDRTEAHRLLVENQWNVMALLNRKESVN